MRFLRDSGVRFVAVDMPEANDLTVGIMALVAQAEREAISRRTKQALAVAKARGVKLGNPNGAESRRRAGKGGVALRAQKFRQMRGLCGGPGAGAHGYSECRTYLTKAELTARGISTRGRMVRVSNVKDLLDRLGCKSL